MIRGIWPAFVALFLFAAAPNDVDLIWAVKIPMRDGVRLNATIYKPGGNLNEKLPVIFTLTPYIADSYHDRAMYFARNGFVFALVDMRGRGNSEGVFRPSPRNANEGEDGYDLVEWFAKQPWCDGQVAMWGGSYAGYNQWITAKEFPPHLKTIVPAACSHPCIDLSAVNNIFPSSEARWMAMVSEKTVNESLYSDSEFWIAKFQKRYRNHLPFEDLDLIAGIPSAAFREELSHPSCDEYWRKWALSEEDYAKINLPVLSITGQFDDQQRGQLFGYRKFTELAKPESSAKHYLIIGPWDHAGTRTPAREVGGLTFGEASMIDLNALHRDWYNWVMKRGNRPDFLKERIAYYVTVSEEWRYANHLDEISKRKLAYYPADGRLHTEPVRSPSINRYIYDPLDITPGDNEWKETEAYLVDQTAVKNLGEAGLIFDSTPWEAAAEIAGPARLVAYISMNVPDTDFQASLYEVLSDGRSILLSEDRLRARYRESLSRETFATPGEIHRYEFSTFSFFARKISAGSKLRLVLRSPNSIYWEKNYNSGGIVAKETARDARTAEVTLHQSKQHPSVLEVGLMK